MKRDISKFGVVVTIVAVIIFTTLWCLILGLPGLVVGPITALMAVRPGYDGGPWAWEKNEKRFD